MIYLTLNLTFFFLIALARADLADEKRALVNFLSQVHRSRDLNWIDDPISSSAVCTNWTGITCDPTHTHVLALRLPAVGLSGPLPPLYLPHLQTLSLRSNSLSGPLPLSLPPNLTTLNLSFNLFNGSIPPQYSQLSHLNLSHNLLSGPIPPELLRRFPISAFSANDGLRLPTIPSSPAAAAAPAQRSHRKRLSESAILAITVGGFAVLFVLAAVFMVVAFSGRGRSGDVSGGKGMKGTRDR